MQKGFVFDVNKCTGCSACRIACAIENDLDAGLAWRDVGTFNPARIPGVPVFHHSLACNHCFDAPCLRSCPANAYQKDPVTGAVTVDGGSCIGCKYCAWACPFDAPKLNLSTGVIEKCTLCNDRIKDGLEPACVTLCPTGALGLADVTPNTIRNEEGFPKTDIKTAIEFVPLDSKRRVPTMSYTAGATPHSPAPRDDHLASRPKVSLRSEWVLVLFTQILAWLCGYVAAVLVGGSGVHAVTFGLVGLAGLAVSGLHLGKKRRAARALLNWRRSWLSREVILCTLFVLFAGTWLVLVPGSRGIGIWVLGLGISALFSIDRVYGVTKTPGVNWHSGQALATGAYVAGLLTWNGELLVGLAGFKLLAYGVRKHRFFVEGRDPRIGTSLLRILFGIVIPIGVWIWHPEGTVLWAILSAGVGEMIDRCEFYAELDVETPRRQMIVDLKQYTDVSIHAR